jgi:hypothetical protein
MSKRSIIAVLALVLGTSSQFGCAKEDDENLAESAQGAGASKGKSDNPNGSASCANTCEGASEDGSCWCDSGCDLIGDCCADYEKMCANTTPASGGSSSGGASAGGSGGATGGTGGKAPTGGTGGVGGTTGAGGAGYGGTTGNPNSCAGHCGSQSAGGTCYCDAACQQSGDCCPDFASLCGGSVGAGGATSGGCTPTLCANGQPATENGAPCYCDPMCMAYGDCCMNKVQVCGF